MRAATAFFMNNPKINNYNEIQQGGVIGSSEIKHPMKQTLKIITYLGYRGLAPSISHGRSAMTKRHMI